MLKSIKNLESIIVGLLFAFLVNSIGPQPTYAQDLILPVPGTMVHLSPVFNPPILKGIKVNPENPFRFEFILDKGDSNFLKQNLKDESSKLIKYFLASLTIPEKDLWVNLSPYEKDRIIPDAFGKTEMGRDLLAQDYMLKQITASLIYPEDEVGKKFWKRIYEEAAKKFGTTNIPVNTFNKVWIVPEKAVVYENAKAGTAYVVESKLKVMLEQDYLALQKSTIDVGQPKQSLNETSTIGSQIVREIIIPQLTKEINTGSNFTKLRQVYNSLILATWYKKKIKDSILSQVYGNKNKVIGVNIDDPHEKQRIYERYLQAFKKGAYNYIKEEIDPITQLAVPRKYFSGGMGFGGNIERVEREVTVIDQAQLSNLHLVNILANLTMPDRAMVDYSRRLRYFDQLRPDVQEFLRGPSDPFSILRQTFRNAEIQESILFNNVPVLIMAYQESLPAYWSEIVQGAARFGNSVNSYLDLLVRARGLINRPEELNSFTQNIKLMTEPAEGDKKYADRESFSGLILLQLIHLFPLEENKWDYYYPALVKMKEAMSDSLNFKLALEMLSELKFLIKNKADLDRIILILITVSIDENQDMVTMNSAVRSMAHALKSVDDVEALREKVARSIAEQGRDLADNLWGPAVSSAKKHIKTISDLDALMEEIENNHGILLGRSMPKELLLQIPSIPGTVFDPDNPDGHLLEVAPGVMSFKPNTMLTQDDLESIKIEDRQKLLTILAEGGDYVYEIRQMHPRLMSWKKGNTLRPMSQEELEAEYIPDQEKVNQEITDILQSRRMADPLRLLSLLRNGISEGEIIESAKSLSDLKYFSQSDLDRNKQILTELMPYFESLYEQILKQYSNDKIIFAGRATRILYVFCKIKASLEKRDVSRFTYIRWEKGVLEHLDSNHRKQLIENLGINEEALHSDSKYVIIGNDRTGEEGVSFREAIEEVLGTDIDLSAKIPIRLISLFKSFNGENITQFDSWGLVDEKTRTAFDLGNGGLGADLMSDKNVLVSELMRTWPQYYVWADSVLTNNFLTRSLDQEDAFNPVAALRMDTFLVGLLMERNEAVHSNHAMASDKRGDAAMNSQTTARINEALYVRKASYDKALLVHVPIKSKRVLDYQQKWRVSRRTLPNMEHFAIQNPTLALQVIEALTESSLAGQIYKDSKTTWDMEWGVIVSIAKALGPYDYHIALGAFLSLVKGSIHGNTDAQMALFSRFLGSENVIHRFFGPILKDLIAATEGGNKEAILALGVMCMYRPGVMEILSSETIEMIITEAKAEAKAKHFPLIDIQKLQSFIKRRQLAERAQHSPKVNDLWKDFIDIMGWQKYQALLDHVPEDIRSHLILDYHLQPVFAAHLTIANSGVGPFQFYNKQWKRGRISQKEVTAFIEAHTGYAYPDINMAFEAYENNIPIIFGVTDWMHTNNRQYYVPFHQGWLGFKGAAMFNNFPEAYKPRRNLSGFFNGLFMEHELDHQSFAVDNGITKGPFIDAIGNFPLFKVIPRQGVQLVELSSILPEKAFISVSYYLSPMRLNNFGPILVDPLAYGVYTQALSRVVGQNHLTMLTLLKRTLAQIGKAEAIKINQGVRQMTLGDRDFVAGGQVADTSETVNISDDDRFDLFEAVYALGDFHGFLIENHKAVLISAAANAEEDQWQRFYGEDDAVWILRYFFADFFRNLSIENLNNIAHMIYMGQLNSALYSFHREGTNWEKMPKAYLVDHVMAWLQEEQDRRRATRETRDTRKLREISALAGKILLQGRKLTQDKLDVFAILINTSFINIGKMIDELTKRPDHNGIQKACESMKKELANLNKGIREFSDRNETYVSDIKAFGQQYGPLLNKLLKMVDQYQNDNLLADAAMNAIHEDWVDSEKNIQENDKTGGIDLTSDKALTVQNNGQAIKFRLDPVQLAQWQNAPGVTFDIIDIQPMVNIWGWLGLGKPQKI